MMPPGDQKPPQRPRRRQGAGNGQARQTQEEEVRPASCVAKPRPVMRNGRSLDSNDESDTDERNFPPVR
jgi:hypothetical protein